MRRTLPGPLSQAKIEASVEKEAAEAPVDKDASKPASV